jgi:hypothetical protein
LSAPRNRRRSRRARPGNALVEFVLTLPFVFFLMGLTMVMAIAMLTKQKALVQVRADLWASAGSGYWSDLKLEDYTPGITPADNTNRPRGSGEELDRLRADIWSETFGATTDSMAHDYWARIWDNLPGRHDHHVSMTSRFGNKLINGTVHAEHFRDTSCWQFSHIDAWRIARSGPLKEIYESFRDNLETQVAPHFEPTRDDIIKRWWHGQDVLQDQADFFN